MESKNSGLIRNDFGKYILLHEKCPDYYVVNKDPVEGAQAYGKRSEIGTYRHR